MLRDTQRVQDDEDTRGQPYADSRLVTFLERRIRDMKRKTQAEIAMEAGFMQST